MEKVVIKAVKMDQFTASKLKWFTTEEDFDLAKRLDENPNFKKMVEISNSVEAIMVSQKSSSKKLVKKELQKKLMTNNFSKKDIDDFVKLYELHDYATSQSELARMRKEENDW